MTGVQTCALPISVGLVEGSAPHLRPHSERAKDLFACPFVIERKSCGTVDREHGRDRSQVFLFPAARILCSDGDNCGRGQQQAESTHHHGQQHELPADGNVAQMLHATGSGFPAPCGLTTCRASISNFELIFSGPRAADSRLTSK